MARLFHAFHPDNRNRSVKSAKIYAAYEIAYTLVDFSAAMLFLVGSYLFFFQTTTNLAIWMFIVGSALFGLKPTLTLAREIHIWRSGDVESLAEKGRNEGK